MSYAPDWDIDLREGEAAEALVLDLITDDTLEVKRDRKARSTGNLYVETHCKRSDGWHYSGICTTKATVWFFVLEDTDKLTVSIGTDALKREVKKYYEDKSKRAEQRYGTHPTKGVLVPLADVLKRARTA